MKLWKVLGVAGLAGVAATGVVVARGERRRNAYTPDDVRARLHARLADVEPEEPADVPVKGRTWRWTGWLRELLGRSL